MYATAVLMVFAVGLCCLLWQNRIVRALTEELEQERKESAGQLAALKSTQWVYRDIWDHLPDYLEGMSEDRKTLAWTIGTVLPRLDVPTTPHSAVDEAPLRPLDLDRLVANVNDPTITALWEERSFWSLHEMLRVLLFQTWTPGFNGKAGWA